MLLVANIVVGLVALMHLAFLLIEMFLWEKPVGLKVFRNTKEHAALTKVMAANQGLYNGFLSAGLFWGLWQGVSGFDVKVFFLLCVVVAGIYGAYSVSRKIFTIQALPAIVGIALLVASQ